MTMAKKAIGRMYIRMRDDERGQATTEYAILVGVIVVIAIVAIIAFRGKITELWQAITDGINSL
ncbi:MAG: class III signal peptide-containing protein [Atopobiaceae bacterium]|nr:class III signal peptide-containing protein [Atopobiaceae bacterium]